MKKYSILITEEKVKEEEKEASWKLSIDVSKIWKQYESNQVTLEQFNNAYITFLKRNQETIQNSTNSWDKLNEIIIKLEEKKADEEGSISIWDEIYDWGDSNLVEIKAQNKSDF